MPRCLRDDLRILLKVAKHADSLWKEEYKSIRVRDFQLIYEGKKFSAAELELLPEELRPSSLCTVRAEDSLTFFGKHSPLSNHHPSPFVHQGTHYATVEQYLAVAMAKISGNRALVDKALTLPNLSDSKAILNSLRESCPQEWQEQRADVLMEPCEANFFKMST